MENTTQPSPSAANNSVQQHSQRSNNQNRWRNKNRNQNRNSNNSNNNATDADENKNPSVHSPLPSSSPSPPPPPAPSSSEQLKPPKQQLAVPASKTQRQKLQNQQQHPRQTSDNHPNNKIMRNVTNTKNGDDDMVDDYSLHNLTHRHHQAISKNNLSTTQQQQQQQTSSRNHNRNGNRNNNNNNNTNNSNNNSNYQQQQQQQQPSNPYRKKQVNTESFEPSHAPPDMRVVIDLGKDKLTSKITERDVLLCPNLFTQPGDENIYDRLMAEMARCSVPQSRLMKLWHGDNHLIADDKTGFAKECPTFQMIVERMKTFFNMKVNATRFNHFRDTSDWKPQHHDAAQFNSNLAKIQNITVGVSFGATRDADFEEVESKKVIRFPLTNGATYVFCRETNLLWRHGIPQVAPEKQKKEGRISIIAWGWVDQVTYDKLEY